MTVLLAAIFASDGFHADADDNIRKSLERLVREDGYDGPIQLYRDETTQLQIEPAPGRGLILFEAVQGGVDRDPNGEGSFHVIDRPKRWRALVNLRMEHVYRMFGFHSGNDFSEAVRSGSTELKSDEARYLCDGYVRLAYSEQATVVDNLFEARRFIEDEMYSVVEASETTDIVQTFLKRQRVQLERAFSRKSIRQEENGYKVTVVVAKSTRPHVEPIVEFREVTFRISRKEGIDILLDRVVASAEASVHAGR